MKLEANFLVICCAVLVANGETVPEKTRLGHLAVEAELGEFPYYALMKDKGKPMCGGALISRTHVLTAAHCVDVFMSAPDGIARITIEVGSVHSGSGETHKVRRLSHHRYFSLAPNLPVIQPNDVSVVTLSTPVTESPNVKPISLPSPSQDIPVGSETVVCGFGSREKGLPPVWTLRKAEMFIVSPDECLTYYNTLVNKAIPPSQLCARAGYGHGTCTGDSGGPLIYNNQVIGIVSAGDGHCSNGSPDIYTKVINFLPYIKSEMEYDFQSKDGSTELAIGMDFK